MLGNGSPEAVAQSVSLRGPITTNGMPQVGRLGLAMANGDASPAVPRPMHHQSRLSKPSWCSTPGQSRSFVSDSRRQMSSSPTSAPISPMCKANLFPSASNLFASLSDNIGAAVIPVARSESRLFPSNLPIQQCISVVQDEELLKNLMGIFSDKNSLSLLPCISPAQFIGWVLETAQDVHTQSLANAMLAWAYHLLSLSPPHQSSPSYANTFLEESKRLVDFGRQKAISVTLVQSLSTLALVDMAEGNDEEAWNQAKEAAILSTQFCLSNRDATTFATGESRGTHALAFCSQITFFRYVEPQDPRPFLTSASGSHWISWSRMLRLLTGRLEPSTNPLYMTFEQEGADIAIDRGP